MDIYYIAGMGAAIVIGLCLGLIGGGGSILTVPAMVYLLGISPVLSTAYSLFVVGLTSLIGSIAYMRKGLVSYKTAVVFAIPSFISVYLTRKYIIPALPEVLYENQHFVLNKDLFVMLLFASLMTIAAYSMIRKERRKASTPSTSPAEFNFALILAEGAVVGVMTGLVGAGGGFLIIPALVIVAKLNIKTAIGTSLVIIAAKSLIGFIGDIGEQAIDWPFLIIFSTLAIAGILVGSYLSNYVSGSRLKPAFGWFVLCMGFFIIAKELYQL